MANICTSEIIFYSKDKKQLEEFHTLLSEAYRKSASTSLEEVSQHILGLKEDELPPFHYGNTFISDMPSKIKCLSEYQTYYFNIYSEARWEAENEGYFNLLDKIFDNNKIYIAYYNEEYNEKIFEKYDPDNMFFANAEYRFIANEPENIIEKFKGFEFPDDFYEFGDCNLKTDDILKIFKANNIDEAKEKMEQYNQKQEEMKTYDFVNFYEIEKVET